MKDKEVKKLAKQEDKEAKFEKKKGKEMPEGKEPKGHEKMEKKAEKEGVKESRYESSKSDSKPRLKNEMAGQHQTGLDHPAAQYDSYKRPRREG